MTAVITPERSPATSASRPSARRVGGVVAIFALVLAGAFVLAVAFGSVRIPLGDVVRILLGGDVARASWRIIVFDFRLPRALTATVAGAALGVGGLQMQTLFRNPLADPFILGVSSGASLGVALVVLTAGAGGSTLLAGLQLMGNVSVALAATVGATVVMALVLAVSRRVRSMATVLIIGLMVGYATTAVVSLLVHTGFGNSERLRAYATWSAGSFRGTTWTELRVFLPAALITLVLAMAMVKWLNALLLGEGYAASMGVPVARARIALIIASSALAGIVTAFCGPIAFVGIAVPHLARGLLRTSDHRILLPVCVLLGGTVALLADLAAQTPGSDTVLPLNAVTSVVGAPVVVAVLLRHRRAMQSVVT